MGVGHALEEARGGVVNRCNTGGVGVGSPVCGIRWGGGANTDHAGVFVVRIIVIVAAEIEERRCSFDFGRFLRG